MGITLNGVGQGSITGRIVELPRAGGVKRALVDMDKTCAPINLGQLATKCRIESKGKKALRNKRDAYYRLKSTPCIELYKAASPDMTNIPIELFLQSARDASQASRRSAFRKGRQAF
jgi:hypothetical protein